MDACQFLRMTNAAQSIGNVVSDEIELELFFSPSNFLFSHSANEIIKKKIAKRDVDEIEIPVDDSSSSEEDEESSSGEEILETTTLDLLTLDSTTEQAQTFYSINLDPFVTPKESEEVEEEETSTEEQTKSLIEPETATEIQTSPITESVVESSTFKEAFAPTELSDDEENFDELRVRNEFLKTFNNFYYLENFGRGNNSR